MRRLFSLTNLSTTAALTPIRVSPACMFRRARIIANGSAMIEYIEEYGRLYQIFAELLPPQHTDLQICPRDGEAQRPSED